MGEVEDMAAARGRAEQLEWAQIEARRLHRCAVYVGRKSCGCAVAACVDDPKFPKDTAQAVADFIKGGLTVERHPGGARVTVEFCHCDPKPGASKPPQLDLLGPGQHRAAASHSPSSEVSK